MRFFEIRMTGSCENSHCFDSRNRPSQSAPCDWAHLDLRDIVSVVPELKIYLWGENGCASRYSGPSSIPSPLSTKAKQGLRDFAANVTIGDDMFFGVLPKLLGPRSKRPPIVLCGTSILHWRPRSPTARPF